MKRLILLLMTAAVLLLSVTTLAQNGPPAAAGTAGAAAAPTTLKPQRIVDWKGDTLYAFTKEQYREAIKRIVVGQFDQAEVKARVEQVSVQEQKLEAQQCIIDALESNVRIRDLKLADRDSLITLQDSLVEVQQTRIGLLDRELRRAARSNWMLKAGAVLVLLIMAALLKK